MSVESRYGCVGGPPRKAVPSHVAVAVGTLVTQHPPHGSGLALISASGSYRRCLASKRRWGYG
jgi:hypothetical protein